MNETEIYAALTAIFHELFLSDDIVLSPGLTAKDVAGWDSFRQIEIVMAAEERFGVKFSTRELDRLKCVGDLAGLIAAKCAVSA